MKLLAAVALLGLAILLMSGGASASDPPQVRSGSAVQNCQTIVDAGYSPANYVLTGGKWQYRPNWNGANGARMSSIWGSVTICTVEIVFDPVTTTPLERREEEVDSQPHTDPRITDPRVLGDPNVDIHVKSGDPNDRKNWIWLRPDHDEWCEDRDAIIAGCGRLVGKIQYENIGRADPNKPPTVTVLTRQNKPNSPDRPVIKRETKQCVARDCLSGQEWYDTYGTEHPKGASYVPGKVVDDDDWDRDRGVRRANENSRSGCLWDGTKYVKSGGSTSGCTQPPPKTD